MTTPWAGEAAPDDCSPGRLASVRRFLGGLTGRQRKYPRPDDWHPTIALVSDAIFPYHRGGKEIRYHELSRRLAAHAEVHVYTMQWWEGPREFKDEAVTLHGISPLRSMYTHSRRSVSQAIIFAVACTRLLAARFDVLEADHMPYFQIFVLRLVATVRRKRFVVTWHEVWGRSYWRQYLGLFGLIAWYVEELAMRLPDHIIAASPHTAQRLRASLGANASITVAPNGIDLEAVLSSYADQDSYTDLVVVSRLMPHKRVDMLLQTVALLHTQGIPVTCRIIGDGPERQNLRNLAQILGVDWAVDFRHDIREQKEIYALVKAAKVFVFPSAREGFGIAVLEALACGLPVVTTSDPDNLAQHLVARSSNGIVCASNPPAVADAVKCLLEAQAASSDKDDAALDVSWLADYDWNAITSRVMTALQI